MSRESEYVGIKRVIQRTVFHQVIYKKRVTVGYLREHGPRNDGFVNRLETFNLTVLCHV